MTKIFARTLGTNANGAELRTVPDMDKGMEETFHETRQHLGERSTKVGLGCKNVFFDAFFQAFLKKFRREVVEIASVISGIGPLSMYGYADVY